MFTTTKRKSPWSSLRYESKWTPQTLNQRPGVWPVFLQTLDPRGRGGGGGASWKGSPSCHVQALRFQGALFLPLLYLKLSLPIPILPSTHPLTSSPVLSGWAECPTAPEAPEWELASTWELIYNLQIIVVVAMFLDSTCCFVSLCRRQLERLLFGHLQEIHSFDGRILKIKKNLNM